MATLATYDEDGKLKYESAEAGADDEASTFEEEEEDSGPKPRKKRYTLNTVWGPLFNSQNQPIDAYGNVYDGYAQPEPRFEVVTESEGEDPLALPAPETMDEATADDNEEDWLQRRIELGDDTDFNMFMQSVPEIRRADYEIHLLGLAPQYRIFIDFIASPLESGKDAVARIEYIGGRYAHLSHVQRLRLLHCVQGWPHTLYTQHRVLASVQIAVAQHVELMP